MHVKGMLSLGAALAVAVALVSTSGAGTTASRSATRIDVSSRAAVVHYLRAIHVNPTGLVIQRGARNYAGPKCPGKGWTCTSTAHPVVQVAPAGGKNNFECSATHCAVVQAAESPLAENISKCIKTTGITQSCSISQTSTSADNRAIVVESVIKTTGLTQNASQTAQIVQQAVDGSNRACVSQTMLLDTSTVAARGMPVLATLDGHQSISITQDSAHGNNRVDESANTDSGGSCNSSQYLTQSQTIKQTATGSARITQNENAADLGPNVFLEIKQNKSQLPPEFGNPSGTNTAAFSQVNALTAIARTPIGPVTQTQVSPSGGMDAEVNQFSHGESHATAIQTETQCEHAQTSTSGTPTCTTGNPPPPPFMLRQVQYGHVRKGDHPSTQSDNPNDSFTIDQNSTQDADKSDGQINSVQADCGTSGNCNGDELVKVQTANPGGTTTHNTQSGTGNVQFSVDCTSTSCKKTNSFPTGHLLVSVPDGLVQEWDVTGATPTLARTLDTTKGAGVQTAGLGFDSAGTLYVTDFQANDVSHFNGDGTLFGSFGSGYNTHPESILFDSSGNAYVGQADGSKSVLKFSPSGALVASFSPATEDRGTDWIDLAPDQCTLYYTSEGTLVKRFDVCGSVQLADFATLLGAHAYAVKVLPGGGALVADTDSIVRLDASGNVIQPYGSGESGLGGAWFSLALDPSGTAFWAGDVFTGDVKKFDLSSGSVLASFNTGLGAADGLAIAP